MQKILLAVDPVNPDKNALDFACFLGRLTRSKITGVFLEDTAAAKEPVLRKVHGMLSENFPSDKQPEECQTIDSVVEKNITWFKEACASREVNCKLHRDRGVPAIELLAESRFADMIVTGPDTSFNRLYEGRPTEFLKEILMKTACPVIISPERFGAIDEIVLAYDGSPSSIFAIKQFTYLFPQLSGRKITLIQINKKGIWEDPDKYYLTEWLKEHYTDLHFETRKGDSDTELFEWLFKRKNTFVVMGAYGRTTLSQFFKRSHAELLIHLLSQPIFIAHL
ncbi:MAG: universal stress protein [Bacteroidota bacterium]